MAGKPILEIPPFPGARISQFAQPGGAAASSDHDNKTLLEALRSHRVGGCYWGRQPQLPETGYVLDGTANAQTGTFGWNVGNDPWHLFNGATRVRLPHRDNRALLVFAAGLPLIWVSAEGSEQEADDAAIALSVAEHLTSRRWANPFDGRTMSPLEVIELCGFWRRMIDSNRKIHSVMGIAYWKKPTVTPLLWAGAPVPYNRSLGEMGERTTVAVWRSRLSPAQRREIATAAPAMAEIEDGFIRSAGLGANCVPPQSIIVDQRGVHFAPDGSSEIEHILQETNFTPEMISRARTLRQTIIAHGLSKYERGASAQLKRPGGKRRHVLVPGQVEDDRSITSGGALPTNLELLRRARAEVGRDAYLIYKPHPDVMAGHRRGLVSDADMAALADHVETEHPMAALLAMVDELHVNSSLAGFEGLMRGKHVTVHGVPFYAGWGLTIDHGPIPSRRTATRSLDQLVAAALLLYPRYLDPETGLPCSAEVLVDRLGSAAPSLDRAARTVIAVRRATGRLTKVLRS